MATAKPNPQQIAQQAAAATKAKNAAIQAPMRTTPPPNMAALQKIAPSVAGDLAKEQQAKLQAEKQALAARPQATPLPPPTPPRPIPPTPPRPIPSAPQDVFDAYGKLLNPGGRMVGYDEGVYNADGTPLNPLVTPPRPPMGMGQPIAGLNGMTAPVSGLGDLVSGLGTAFNPAFAQPYVQGLGAMAAQRLGAMAAQGLGAMAARPAPKSNPMTGLGAFSANPNIAAANPFATLGVTAGAQQAQQNIQPPYNPSMDTFQGNQQAPASFGQSVGQLFQGLGGQAQTQQSPYSQQQASNLMQNTGQVGQNAYGSFVGQQKPQQQQMQQPQPQQTAQTAQNSVAPPMQAGFNFFNQDQGQGNTGGGTMGGGGLF